jgi:hypothetical protein
VRAHAHSEACLHGRRSLALELRPGPAEGSRHGGPVVHVFVEKAELSVSETGEAGFRKVRLPGGAVGWIEERALALAAPAAARPVAAAAPAAAPAPASTEATPAAATPSKPDLRARIYVKDLDHFAELVKEDKAVHERAAALVARRRAARWTGLGGAVLGIGLLGASMLVPDSCDTRPVLPGFPELGNEKSCGPGAGRYALLGAGAFALTGGAVGFAVLTPRRNDFLDVVNQWNGRHLDQPFEITSR